MNQKINPYLYWSIASTSLSSSNSTQRVFLQLNNAVIVYYFLSIMRSNSETNNTQIYLGYK